jgi:hypothetical protein
MIDTYSEFLEELLRAGNRERKPGDPPLTIEDVRRIHEENCKECLEIYERLENCGYAVVGALQVESFGKVMKKTSEYTC